MNTKDCLKSIQKTLKVVFLFAVFAILSTALPVHSQPPKRVFILMSYKESDTCGGPQYKGVLSALQSNSSLQGAIILKTYFLKSKTLPPKDVENRKKEAISLFKRFNPDVTISIDDLAFQTLVPFFLSPKGHGYLVFTGINITPEEYNKRYPFHKDRIPTGRITGIYEKLFMVEQLEFLKMIRPISKGDKVAILYSDDPVGTIVRNQLMTEVKGTKFKSLLTSLKVHTLDDVKHMATVIENDKKVVAYIPITLSVVDKQKKGRKYLLQDLAPILLKLIHKPDLTVNSSFVRLGFLGGVSIDFYNLGRRAGEMVRLLLMGYDIKRLRIQDAVDKKIFLNLKRARDLGIELSPAIISLADEIVQ